MIYCYECGEQIAENDVFCPYCGISLSPIKIGGEDSAAIAESDESAAVLPDNIEDFASAPPEKVQPAHEIHNLDNFAPADGDFSNDITSENLQIVSAATPPATILPNETPDEKAAETLAAAPILNAGAAQTFASTAETNAPPLEDETTESAAVELIESADTPETPVAESVPESPEIVEMPQTESSLMDYDEAEVKEIPSPDEPETTVEEAANDIESVASSSLEPEDSALQNIVAADLDDEDAEMERAFAADENIPETAAAPEVSPVETPIPAPPEELIAESPAPPAQFDSVRIMEATQSPSPENPKAADEKKSFTQPNLSNGETGGKDQKKLKPLDEGTVLNGRYEIVRKIGGGGMGAVYLASDKNLGGVLRAVKEMVQSYIEEEQQDKAVNDFKRESLLLTSLDHQSIPTIYDYFFDEKEARFYLVMKYISGGDLAARLRSAPTGRIDEAEVTKWAIQITDVLDYLHNRQPPIVYRDLKPANIMIDANSGRTMLIDFGIARWVNKEEKGVTAVGTMGYAPPELFSGNVESRSDIYSLGSTMFHLLTGADPQSNPLLIFDFQKNPRPRQINSQLSDQMERILMRSVEYNADKRFKSSAEMRNALEEHLENIRKGAVTYGVKEAPAAVSLSDQPVFCGFCGQKIVANDMFCAFCGAKQPLAQSGVHHANYTPSLTAQLLVVGTSDLEQPAFRLEKDENLVGRRDPQSNIFPEVDLSKYDPQTKISRRHARIWREGGEFMVEDLGSSNGTYLLPVISDTVRLQPRQPKTLTNGDKIRLGDTTLHFVVG